MIKTIGTALVLLLLASLLGGCEREDPVMPDPDDSIPTPKTALDATDTKAETSSQVPQSEIVIETSDQIKYSRNEFTVTPGATVNLILRNSGPLPKSTMGHNVVILTAHADVDAFVMEAEDHRDNDYIPENMSESMIAHTDLLGGGQTDSITFTAPDEPGDYPYLCSFPSHYQMGMKGTMHVR